MHISAIYENFGSNKNIKPADENDYDPQYRYFIRLCAYPEENPCQDMTKCEDYTQVRGYITKLSRMCFENMIDLNAANNSIL